MRGPAIVLLVLLAGCSTPPPATDEPAAEDSPNLFGAWCPPRAEPTRGARTCTDVLGDEGWKLSAPAVAVDPKDLRRFAVAAVAVVPAPEAVATVVEGLPDPAGAARPCRGQGVCVFWTEDEGSTWRHSNLPAADGMVPAGQPAMAFDGDGFLHVVALFAADGDAIVQQASTSDGARWSDPVSFSLNASVQPLRMALDLSQLTMVWEDPDGRLRGAEKFVHAGGWTAAEGQGPTCVDASGPALLPTHYMGVACANANGTMDVWEINHGRWAYPRPLPNGTGPILSSGTRIAGAAFAYQSPDQRPVLASMPTPPTMNGTRIDLYNLSAPESADSPLAVQALALDGLGNAHLLIVPPGGEFVHVAVSRLDGRRVALTPLIEEADAVPLEGDANPPAASLAFWETGAVAIWERNDLLEWTFLRRTR